MGSLISLILKKIIQLMVEIHLFLHLIVQQNPRHKVQVGRKHNLTSDVWDHMTRVILMEMLAATAKQHLKLLAPMVL